MKLLLRIVLGLIIGVAGCGRAVLRSQLDRCSLLRSLTDVRAWL
jgi:hypothetical protein